MQLHANVRYREHLHNFLCNSTDLQENCLRKKQSFKCNPLGISQEWFLPSECITYHHQRLKYKTMMTRGPQQNSLRPVTPYKKQLLISPVVFCNLWHCIYILRSSPTCARIPAQQYKSKTVPRGYIRILRISKTRH